MNFFGLFSKTLAKTNPPPKVEYTVNILISLREQIELLEKRKEIIKRKQDSLILEAKHKLSSGDKKAALLLLNQKKQHEAEADKITSSQLLLENQLFTLEGVTINKEVINTLKIGNDAIKNVNKDITPDLIDEIMDDIQETQYTTQQIQQMLNTPLQDIYNDAELLAELAELDGLGELSEINQPMVLPAVPQTNPTVIGKADVAISGTEDEIMLDLRRLEESMLVRT